MSELAKKARAAMKSKANRLGSDRPLEKVDSSSWTPPEMLNAEAKTGLRPISRRAFKKGGKVMGETCEARADRKPRKAGGKAGNKPVTPDSFINKNVKEANEERPGVKHIGGMKKGGRAGKNDGGGALSQAMKRIKNWATNVPEGYGQKPGKDEKPVDTSPNVSAEDRAKMDALVKSSTEGMKKGGRTKKAMGGPDMGDFGPGVAGAAEMMKKAGRAGVPGGGLYGAGFSKIQRGALSPAKGVGYGMKKGGTAKKHEDEAQDRALFKKMEKAESKKERHEDEAMDKALIKKMVKAEARTGKKDGGERKGRATGGEVFSGAGYPHKVPGVVPGGRTAKASGGKTKGKTNINIVIAAGKPAGGDMMGQQPKVPTDGRGAGGIPIPMPPAPGGAPAGMPGGGMPMAMPIPMPPAGGPPVPPGGMPMGRKTGGRVSKIAKSYKDMTAGSGSGEGRLQKTDIAKLHKDAPSFRKGGKVYSSYKDMDAGAGSGEGRLEKTEIQKRKG